MAGPIICHHCGKPIARPKPPRDLSLLLWQLTYATPWNKELSEEDIEAARQHCRMKPERLTALREPIWKWQWELMLGRRARRRAWAKANQQPPPSGWAPPSPGERDRSLETLALRVYRMTAAKMKRRMKRRPDAMSAKINTLWESLQKTKRNARRLFLMQEILARIHYQNKLAQGRPVTIDECLEMWDMVKGRKLSKRKTSPDYAPEMGLPRQK
jgi:hypothetical protein